MQFCGKLVLDDGSTYEGEFVDKSPCGYGTMIWLNNNNKHYKYEGEWKNGFMHGKGCLKFKIGYTYEGNFVNGFLEGYGILYFNGKSYEGDFIKNVMNGKGKMTYFNDAFYGVRAVEGIWKDNMIQ